jgi:negative regulator of flagellin synthesis FlgM
MDIRDVQAGQSGASAPTEASRRTRSVDSVAGESSQPDSRDQVALSPEAQALQQARRAAEDVPEVRQDRVDEIRRALASGTLVPDPIRIARALIAQGVLE